MKYILLLFLCLSVCVAKAQIQPKLRQKSTPPKEPGKLWLFLLAGQSNMAGRGAVEPADTIPRAPDYVVQ